MAGREQGGINAAAKTLGLGAYRCGLAFAKKSAPFGDGLSLRTLQFLRVRE